MAEDDIYGSRVSPF